MIDRASVCSRLHALETYVAELERLATTVTRAEFDVQLSTQWTIEHGLQLAIACVLDIGSHLIAGQALGAPESYREVIEILGERGVVPASFVERVRGMPGFRNILVHDYLAVDLGVVWEMLHDGPGQFREFAEHVARHLQGVAALPR